MRRFGWIILFVAVGAFGKEGPETFPPRFDGVIVKSITDTVPFHLVAGAISNCKQTTAGSWVAHSCDLANAYSVVSHGDEPIHLNFERTLVEKSVHGERTFRKYSFIGRWTSTSGSVPLDSRVVVSVYAYDDVPGQYRGWIELLDYGTKEAVVATESPAAR